MINVIFTSLQTRISHDYYNILKTFCWLPQDLHLQDLQNNSKLVFFFATKEYLCPTDHTNDTSRVLVAVASLIKSVRQPWNVIFYTLNWHKLFLQRWVKGTLLWRHNTYQGLSPGRWLWTLGRSWSRWWPSLLPRWPGSWSGWISQPGAAPEPNAGLGETKRGFRRERGWSFAELCSFTLQSIYTCGLWMYFNIIWQINRSTL